MKTKSRKSRYLLFLAAAALLASCGSGADDSTTVTEASDTAARTQVETETEAPGREAVKDALPEKDWEGREFRITACDYLADDLIVEAETGALIDDAIYKRNALVEERFNVKLNIEASTDYAVLKGKIRSAIMAGDDFADLIMEHMIECASLASQKLFMDINTVPHIDVKNPWWLGDVAENLSVDGKSFMIIGSISPYYTSSNYCVYFNKKLAADLDLGDTLYDKVLDGTWTIDAFSKLVRGTYRDLNGDGQRDEKDFYGLGAQITSYATPYLYAFGEITVKKDADGMPTLDMDLEKTASIVNKVYDLFFENDTITTTGWDLHQDTFTDSRALFLNSVLRTSYTSFADFEDDYGILPYPKWDEAQEKYYTMSDGSSPLCGIPTTVSDPEFAGMITEALAAESWRVVDPAIFDTALKVRGTRDERSVEIIDMVISGSVVDFGYVYGNYNMMGFVLSDMMGRQDKNFMSMYEKQEKRWVKQLNKVIAAYMEE